MLIDNLEKETNIEGIIKCIKEFYINFENELYIPGIYKEGYFTGKIISNKNEGHSDFYAKLIIRPTKNNLDNSWQVMNLTKYFIDLNEYNNISAYNVIVYRKLYGESVYCLNPNLFSDEDYIDEENYKNNNLVNNIYRDNDVELDVLLKDNESILILKKVIENILNHDGEYTLSIEFEYRNYNLHIKENDDYQSDGVYIRNTSNIGSKEECVWLTGTIDIILNSSVKDKLNITVNSIKGGQRDLDISNYNDDMDAGLIVFDYEAISYLNENYIILGLNMIHKQKKSQVLIDPLQDIIVFWEGEFNQLPYPIKKGLEKFNIKSECEGIISPIMYEWQLKANWNYITKGNPVHILAHYLYEKKLELVFEYNCNMYLPNNLEDFQRLVNNILDLFNYKLTDLKERNKDEINDIVDKMADVLSGNNKKVKYEKVYQDFCYIVMNKVDSSYVEELFKEQ